MEMTIRPLPVAAGLPIAERARAITRAVAAEVVETERAYAFVPGESDDGLTVSVPLDVLADLDPGRFEWLVVRHIPSYL